MSILSQSISIMRQIWTHPANCGQRGRAMLAALHWQAHKRLRGSPRQFDYHGLRFILWPDAEQASAVIYFSGWPDYWEMHFIADYLREGDEVLDIGANIGVYTLLCAARVGPGGRVSAFEPDPQSQIRLQAQIEANAPLPQVNIVPHAVTAQSGPVTFSQEGSSATRHMLAEDEKAESSTFSGLALDDWADWQQPALVKIDIEGAEPLAILGASRRLSETPPPVILFELAGYSQRYGYASEQVLAMLAAHDYGFAYYLPEAHRLQIVERPWEHGLSNVLAIQRSCWQEVLKRCQVG